mmetsp:Transcript_92415/g.282927  ORF Transcript_92415/g.282927 Transcript_92415/m.282927 type:complete len:263 (+) Transcript_92415:915-1703(+)
MAALPSSPSGSGGFSRSGPAVVATFSAASSAAATFGCSASMAACASSGLSLSTFFGASPTAAPAAPLPPAPPFAAPGPTLHLTSSCLMLACKVFKRGDNFVKAATTGWPAAPEVFASRASSARLFCVPRSISWAAVRQSRADAAPSGPWARSDFAMASDSWALFSAAVTCSVMSLTLLPDVVAPAGEEAPGCAAPLPAALAGAAWTGLTISAPGFTGWSQGTFHFITGGACVWASQCAHTWVPPTASPNHQPEYSSPSRLSQ